MSTPARRRRMVSGHATQPADAPTIAVTASASTASVVQGSTTAITYTLTRGGSYTDVVTPLDSGLPSGVSASFAPTTFTGATTDVVMTLTATAGATLVTGDAFDVVFSGPSVSSVTKSATVDVTVAPGITVTTGDNTVTLAQGGSTTVSYTLTRVGGYTGDVTPSVSGLPTGITGTWSDSLLSGADAATILTLTDTGGASLVTGDAFTATFSGSGITSATDNGTLDVVVASSVYRGATLPNGITAPASLSDGFGGMTWDYSDLYVGGTRYNAATRLTVSTTGATGRTDLLAHLATVAAGNNDYVIILPTSAALTGGQYTLPAKTFTSKHCWIVNTKVDDNTFAYSRGTKIPASTTNMAILEGGTATLDSIVTFADSGSARGYSFHGCVIQNNQSSASYDIQLGVIEMRRTTQQTAMSGYPGRLYLDRCWLRGSPTTDVRRGILANGPYLAVHDTRISDVHCVGNESAGIAGWTGSQFHDIRRCTIEAGTQTVLYGGADPDNPNTNLLDPADIFIEKVYGFKPLTWLTSHGTYGGIHWSVKTGFESKNVRRLVIDRSWSQNCWPDAQNGYGLLLQNLSDGSNNLSENRIEDVVVRHHQFDYNANGVNLAARVAYHDGRVTSSTATVTTVTGNFCNTAGFYDGVTITITSGTGSGQTRTIATGGWSGGTRQATVTAAWTTTPDATSYITFNSSAVPTNRMTRIVFDNINMTRNGGNRADATSIILNGSSSSLGYGMQLLSDIDNLIIDRWTADGNRHINLEGSGGTSWTLTNHVARQGTYGTFRTGGLQFNAALAASCGTGLTFNGNVGYDLGSGSYSGGIDYNETNASMLFTDYANYDYRLTSAHLTSGVSGGVPGCDINELNSQVSGINS